MSQPPVWFITAASSGFGKYIALEALSRGHKVIASARSTSRIADLAAQGADTVTLDVTAPLEQIQQTADNTVEDRLEGCSNTLEVTMQGYGYQTDPEMVIRTP